MRINLNLIERVKSSTIGLKLFLFFTAMVIIPVVSLSLFLYTESTAIIRTQAVDINELYLTQVNNYMAQELNHSANVSNLIAQHPYVKETLELDPRKLSFSEEFDVMDELIELLENTKITQEIYELRIFMNDSFLYSRSNPLLYELSSVENSEWFQKLKQHNLNQALLAPYRFRYSFTKEAEIISVATLIRSSSDFDNIVGVVMADISVNELNNLFQTISFTEESSIMFLNEQGDVMLDLTNNSGDYQNTFVNLKLPSENSTSIYMDSNFLIGLSSEIFGGWRALSITPLDIFNQPNIDLRDRAILIVLAVTLIAICFVIYFSRYYQRRISSLSDQMLRVEKGDLKVRILVDSGDEIGNLQSSFNFMIRRIESLVSETYTLGQELKGQELRVLQEQINPHFLYNTLDMIYWRALNKNNDEVADTVLKLAKFYRLSLHRGKEFVSLENEIVQSELFIDLLNQRSEKKIKLQLDIPTDLRQMKIMKLTLQPLIENAIMHGLFPSANNDGAIICSARILDGSLHLSICDNGVGISQAKLTNLRHFLQSPTVSQDESGFGLLNTVKRLRMYFGDKFIYDIDSQPNLGTCINLVLPMIDDI